jgi:signal transduction histidine kinase
MRWRPRDPDLVVVLVFFAAHLVDRAVNPLQEGGIAANLIGAVLMSVPFYWRRRRPYLFVGTLVAGALVNDLIDATPVNEMFVALVTLIFVGYTLGRHHEGRDRLIAFAVWVVAIGGMEAAMGGGDTTFVCIVSLGGLVGGIILRNRALLTRELAERTHELEALRAERERDAVLDERRRIARELHDVVAHTVSVMVVQAGGARRQLRRDPDRALAAMDLIETTGEETLVELQRLFGLLADTGSRDLAALAERTRAAGLPVALEVTGQPRDVDPEAEHALYRVVQEALTNTLKHGGAGATARVAVSWSDADVEVVVSDTGHGLEGPRGEGSRRGLVGMRERMAAFGGDVQAGPGPGGGFEVRARLPLAAREEVHA